MARSNAASIPALSRLIYRTSRKHSENYKAKKGSAFCTSAPASGARVIQHRAVQPPEHLWNRATSSRPLVSKSSSGSSASSSSSDYASALNDKFWRTDTSSDGSESSASNSPRQSLHVHTTTTPTTTVLVDMDWLHIDEPDLPKAMCSALHGNSDEPFHTPSVCYNTSEAVASAPFLPSKGSAQPSCLGSSAVTATLYFCPSAQSPGEQTAEASATTPMQRP